MKYLVVLFTFSSLCFAPYNPVIYKDFVASKACKTVDTKEELIKKSIILDNVSMGLFTGVYFTALFAALKLNNKPFQISHFKKILPIGLTTFVLGVGALNYSKFLAKKAENITNKDNKN